MSNGLQRKQVGVPKGNNAADVPAGPTTIAKGTPGVGGSLGLYGVVDRKTPAMSDGSLHGKIGANLTHRSANFDGTIDV